VRLGAATQPPLEYTPSHDFSDRWPPAPRDGEAPDEPASAGDWESQIASGAAIPSRPIRRVVLYGAGGPLAAATTRALADRYRLRLTDRRPLAEIAAENTPQSPGAPVPEVLPAPHEVAVVDVTDTRQVIEAARGMDAIVNCTVVRPDPVESFRVNTLGAFNVMQAAVANGIRRVVHTGPQLVIGSAADYGADEIVEEGAPPRPGDSFYGHTKFLGQEICRVFAEYYALEIPVLLFSIFVNPEQPREPGRPLSPFSVSWEDAALAMRRAVEARGFPSPYELLHIVADLPHGRFTNEKAKRLLDWQPRDRLERAWFQRRDA
jgi:nucleoside-diphosphate-sugar epimerase